MTPIAHVTAELFRHQVSSLPPSFAQLYTNFALKTSGREGAAGWSAEETKRRELDALKLIGVGYSLVRAGDPGDASRTFRRSAELFEWLGTEETDSFRPYALISSLLYQLAGYPAMARTILFEDGDPLSYFVRGAFGSAHIASLDACAQLLGSDIRTTPDYLHPDLVPTDSERHFYAKMLTAINVFCSHLRWGDGDIDGALHALTAVSKYYTYAKDDISWLLAGLFSQIATRYSKWSLRTATNEVGILLSSEGQRALDRYCRGAYLAGRAIAWPSQRAGIQELSRTRNFAVCTPTGSGKTTIAEVAVIQSLFENTSPNAEIALGRLVLYIVPSRALAAEIERRLSKTFSNTEHFPITIVTSYGGAPDNSPLDAWFDSPLGTVIVCTQEKADALARSAGELFLNRLRLIIIDEAHDVQVPPGTIDKRALKLEQFVSRIRSLSFAGRARVIALSAVVQRSDDSLARWLDRDSPKRVDADYRSTRQIFGRLLMSANGAFTARYDVVNGQFLGSSKEVQPVLSGYIPPLRDAPERANEGPEVQLRAVALWTAVHLASIDRPDSGAVLITVGKQINYYASTFVKLLASWKKLPIFHSKPEGPAADMFRTALNSCEDYFGRHSHEYQLLERGIVVHHGNLPPLLSRHFMKLVDERVVRITIATSTLSEGVNLPFETILLPSLRDYAGKPMTPQYIRNVVGRAGRPGVAREGRALVLLGEGPKFKTAQWTYNTLLTTLAKEQKATAVGSALQSVLDSLYARWSLAVGDGSFEDYLDFLESTETQDPIREPRDEALFEQLDEFLLSFLVEKEAVDSCDIANADPDVLFANLWQNTYLYALSDDDRYRAAIVARGQALRRFVANTGDYRRIYGTALGPRAARTFLTGVPKIEELFKTATAFASWDNEGRFDFISSALDAMRTVPEFDFAAEFKKRDPPWRDVLRWWLGLRPESLKADDVGNWYKLANASFSYRFAWAINAFVVSLPRGPFDATTEDVLSNRQLPYLILWLRDMLLWGVLDPLDAAAMHSGIVGTRAAAKQLREEYIATASLAVDDSIYRPGAVRDWIAARRKEETVKVEPERTATAVKLLDVFPNLPDESLRVWPEPSGDKIIWRHVSGYPLAVSALLANVGTPDTHDYMLQVDESVVTIRPYV